MTDQLQCRFEWIDAAGVRDEALARIEVWVGHACVTRALDRYTRSQVEGAHVSLLPLAAWVADVWWTALFEASRRARVLSVREACTPEERSWHRRHGWLSSREGFAVPEVVLSRAEGGTVRVDWFEDRGDFHAMPLRFLESGSAFVPLDIVQHELGRIVEGTLARCEGLSSPVVDALRLRWDLVRSATAEERRACERAARMGLDAYDPGDVDDTLAALLVRPDVALAEPILDDLLDVADDPSVSKLEEQIAGLGALLAEAEVQRAPARQLDEARARAASVHGRPYERGYERARIVRRDVLGLADDVVASALDRAIEANLLPRADVAEAPTPFLFHGIHALATAPSGMPFVVTRPQRWPTGRRFDRARALDALIASETPRLVTASYDPDQQASRAFAAEILAPSSYLRSRLRSHVVDLGDVDDLAAELNVHPQLVRHQLENHQLAEVADA